MNYIIYEDGEEINRIVASDESFVVSWCAENGYTYEPSEDAPEPSEPTEEEDTAALLVDHEYRLTLLELGITE